MRCEEPTEEDKATFTSDGNPQYTNSIEKYYLTKTINYGQLIKIRDENGRLIGKEKRVIFGEVDWIETVYVERYNLTLRCGISRLVRETISFTKVKNMLEKHLDVYQAYNNLIRLNEALTIERKGEKNIVRTPCMAEEITDHRWSWEEMLSFKVSPLI